MTMTSVEDSARLTRPQRRIAITAIGGYFVDGYDLLILSGALLGITPEFHLRSVQLGLLTAAAFLGMALGSAISGPLTDRYGRRVVFFASMILFLVGSLSFLLTQSAWQIIAVRLVIGLAIGADMPAAAALIAEFIPARRRGMYTAFGGVAWMLGSVVAIAVTLLIFTVAGTGAWRWAMATGAIAAAVLLFLRHGTPDSPRWLRSKGREADAQAAWRYAQGDENAELPKFAPTAAPQASARALFRRPLLLVLAGICFYWCCNNLYGSAILLYQPTLISRIVSPGTFTSLLFTGCTSLLAVVIGLIVCGYVVERIGRRFLAIAGTSIVVVASFVLWAAIHSSAAVLIAFAAAIGFINGGTSMAFYAWAPELFPTEFRGRAIGVVNMIGKLGSVVGTFALPLVFDALGGGAFLVIAAIAALNVLVISVLSIETKGQTLEEVQHTAERRFGRKVAAAR
ncbi:MFS transporter [Amycolatopsis acidicola]|uniref:MFS transporter n=1 Tax=Amycolatopsis acidicola TaxID=2596893 RepID=A0A5N0UU68_9PSEU|nr:MFS transporter [Amycolatopsis acidicola]KAA9153597.1 MFS transporter [Amycolatopsis acidicola]